MSKRRIISLIVIGVLLSSVSVLATYLVESSDVGYDNSESDLETDNVQDAIDELYDRTASLQSENTALQEQLVNAAPNYTITFDAQNGESNTIGTAEVTSYKYGDLPTPTKNGYYFVGWYDAAEGGNKIASDTAISENKTIYAQWTPVANKFSTDSWLTIQYAVKNNDASKYSVGNTKSVKLSGYGTYKVRVANKSTPSECSNTIFSQTACGFVVEFAGIITTRVINSSNTVSGEWPASQMRSWLNSSIFNSLPLELKSVIADTTVFSNLYSGDTNTNISTDKLYFLSKQEVWNTTLYEYISTSRQLDYYKNKNVTTSSYSDAIKKNSSSSAYPWWLRTVYTDSYGYFNSVNEAGGVYSGSVWNNAYGVSPAFRIE